MPEFSNYHRAASEDLIAAVNGADTLDRAQHFAEMELQIALEKGNHKREILALGILGVIEEIRQLDQKTDASQPKPR